MNVDEDLLGNKSSEDGTLRLYVLLGVSTVCPTL